MGLFFDGLRGISVITAVMAHKPLTYMIFNENGEDTVMPSPDF